MARKRYSPSFKFQVVLDTLKDGRTDAEVARQHDVHPVTVGKWRRIRKRTWHRSGSSWIRGDP